MGIETSAEHGGAESSFTSAIIAIEELARVDPSVSVMCDVHNTLVNTVVRKYGTKEQQDKWLPKLAESMVRHRTPLGIKRTTSSHIMPVGWLLLPVRARVRLGRVRAANARGERRERLGDQRLQDVDHQLV